MKVIFARNVREALPVGIRYLLTEGIQEDSRAGKVLVLPCPVSTVYSHPQERVLLSPIRDSNPFFSLMESLWMLSGRNDAKWLDQFVKDFSSRFAEEDGIQHGAYGYRWRHAFGFDQLGAIVNILKKDPTSRQCVLQMWDCRDDNRGDLTTLYDLTGNWKDRPCNTHVYFRVRDTEDEVTQRNLDITVCCRSNDVVWGAYGANAVHFSVLQEYMAARIGVGIGTYYQMSNNYHIYENLLEKMKGVVGESLYEQTKPLGGTLPIPMVTDPKHFDHDLQQFMRWTDRYEHGEPPCEYNNPWFSNTAEPLFAAYERWRVGERNHALEIVSDPIFSMALDWRLAAQQWFHRRMK